MKRIVANIGTRSGVEEHRCQGWPIGEVMGGDHLVEDGLPLVPADIRAGAVPDQAETVEVGAFGHR